MDYCVKRPDSPTARGEPRVETSPPRDDVRRTRETVRRAGVEFPSKLKGNCKERVAWRERGREGGRREGTMEEV